MTACSTDYNLEGSRKEKLPKSVIEPWFDSKVESNDKTAGGALDLILRLRGELQKADNQLRYVRENYVEDKAP